MRIRSVLGLVAAMGLIALTSGTAQAAVLITGLNNTGTSGEGNPDSNYQVVAAPSGVTLGNTIGTTTNGFPIPPWIANTTTSRWVQPVSADLDNQPVGNYEIVTTFNVDPNTLLSSIVISGQWAADNSATMAINGNAVPGTATGFTSWTPFSINSGFITGVNQIKFFLTNAAGTSLNPTGLRIEFNAPQAVAVPEPATFVSAGVALAGLALARRFRARRAVA